MTDNEISMLASLIVQITVGVLGAASIAAADWLYQEGCVRQGLHSIWVSCSMTAVCVPVVAWTSTVFLGSGMPSQVLICTMGALIFFRAYNLSKLPPVRELGYDLTLFRFSVGPISQHQNPRAEAGPHGLRQRKSSNG